MPTSPCRVKHWRDRAKNANTFERSPLLNYLEKVPIYSSIIIGKKGIRNYVGLKLLDVWFLSNEKKFK